MVANVNNMKTYLDAVKHDPDIAIPTLPIRYLLLGDDEFGIGFFDAESKTFFQWKDITIRKTKDSPKVPPFHATEFTRIVFLRKNDKQFMIKPYIPPAALMLREDGNYNIGLYDYNFVFYSFRGVVWTKDAIARFGKAGRDNLVPHEKNSYPLSIYTIDPLKYLALYKKGTQPVEQTDAPAPK